MFKIVGAFLTSLLLVVALVIPIAIFTSKPKESTIVNCTFTTGTILAKRQYCTHDCRYTLVVGFDNKSTEVDVPKERYEFGIVGSTIDVLINCK